MARTSVMTGGSNSYQTTAEDLNAIATDFISDGIVGAVTSTSGVAPTTGGLSVNAQGTPDRTVAIGAGYAYVTATPTSQASQRLRVKIDAQNLTHATNVTGSTRFDWIYVQVSASLAANPALAGDTTGTMVISRSTSSSVDNGTPPTYGYHVATVTLVNNWTTVVNGNIADTRVRAGAVASSVAASVTLPTTTIVDARGFTNPYKFDVHPSVDVSVSSSVLTKVQLDTKNFDTGNNFDSVTNYRFTAPIAGFYQISAQVGLTISGYTAVTAYAQITKNGSIYLTSTGLAGSGSTTTINRPVFSKLIQLAAGDYLELWGFIGEAGRQINGPNTYMSGFLVSTT